jgi:hypothetical protein
MSIVLNALGLEEIKVLMGAYGGIVIRPGSA